MKGDKDEEKLMGPLFPRLHIKDAERGGPRAPPRNRMALYERLSIPSQRLTSGSESMTPLPSKNRGSLAPSTSSSRGGGQKRRLYSVICNSPASSHLAERLHSYSSGGMNMNTTLMNLEWQPMKLTKYRTLNAPEHMPLTANCSLFQKHSIPNSKNSSAKELADEIIFEVSTFVQSGRTPNCGNGQPNTDKEKPTGLIANRQIRTARVRQLKQTSTATASILTNGEKVLEDAFSNPLASRARLSESVKGAQLTLDEEKRSSLVDDSSRLHDSNAQLHHECRASKEKNAPRYGVSAEPKKAVGMRNAAMLEGASYFSTPPGDNYRSCTRLDNGSECRKDLCGPFQTGELDGNADISDKSIVDSTSGVNVSPDDVVRVMGQKQFWKARKAILHQQKVFAGQVFALHRLIKVQRLFVSSPDLLLESELSLRKSSIAAKKFPAENALEAPPLNVKQEDAPWKSNPDTECAAENALGKPPFPSLRCATNTKPNTQQSNSKPWSSNPPPAPWCFPPPPRNQWLVPVMSPSEGLIYKPCTLPCPLTSNFMVPVYGSCEPTNPTPVGGDFLSTSYGILSGAPPSLGHTYFPPHSTPLMDLSVSSSAVEPASPFARAQSNEHENHLMGDIKFPMPYQSSCNVSTRKSGVNSYCVGNLQVSKENEHLGSNTSSPSERVQGAALPLFPMDPMKVHISDQPVQTRATEQWTGAIKVVPHNPRSASESAARIFQSIQEERRQYS